MLHAMMMEAIVIIKGLSAVRVMVMTVLIMVVQVMGLCS